MNTETKFDGCKVKTVSFSDLGNFSRFFTDNGIGYTKTGHATCIDDYSQQPIRIDEDSVVWIKEK